MQCENHERFVQVALGYGWQLWEYGTDSECIVGGKDTPHLTPIWMKPCAWDEGQMIPVGCLCCTDLNTALWDYSAEVRDVMEDFRIKKGLRPMPEVALPERPAPLAERPSWLQPYRAR